MDYIDVIERALRVSELAYAPYSKFCVGACLKMKDGSYICGANVENASYGLTSCAERNALFAAYSQGYRKQDIQCMAIATKQDKLCSPCGACRQVMTELLEQRTPIVLANMEKQLVTNIEELMPMAFTAEEFL